MENPVIENTSRDPRVSGRVVVAGMFVLGFLATGILMVYWNLHLAPFMPLQKALVDQFENSSPRVDGGQRKIHKGTPKILRVVMRVPFDPDSSAVEVLGLIEDRIEQTRQQALRLTPPSAFEVLEIHLYQEQKEQALSQKTFLRDLRSGSIIADEGPSTPAAKPQATTE
ncbi:MAG: hypothetical protein R3C49_01150 [Planctomycetaceae bacterium]